MPAALPAAHGQSGLAASFGSAAAHDLRPVDFNSRLARREPPLTALAAPVRRLPPRVLALLLALLSVAALVQSGLLGAVAAEAAPLDGEPAEVQPMPFEQTGQSFPGSAFYYLAADADQAPPPMADSSASLAPDAHWDGLATPAPLSGNFAPQPGPAARALAQAGSVVDRTRALSCLTAAIYYEAASEPDAGQRAVAQVVLNRVAHPSFPKTVCGVVFQGSERSTGCQFTFTCDGALARKPSQFFWQRAENVARAALAGYVYAPVGLATHYHTFAVHPYWADSLNFLGQIGAHRFYRFMGPAGSPGAFHFAYACGEPLDRPHTHAAAPARDSDPDPVAIQRAFAATPAAGAPAPSRASYAAPAYAGEALQRGGDVAFRARNLPEANGIRPEYQQSGQWIAQPQ
jgi:spore germination cell wall hydrolase CwlJ-like protein